MGNSFEHICKYALCLLFVLVWNISRAQDYYNFTQVGAYAGYSWIADTYSHSAYTAGINADYHFHKAFYASVTGRITNYNGRKTSDYEPIGALEAEILNDNLGSWMVGAGPGADIVSNSSDRIFACLYVGYGKVNMDYEVMDSDGYADSFDSHKKGFGCVLQIGYEHCFRAGLVMGASLDGQYLAGNLSWTAGLRLGFRF